MPRAWRRIVVLADDPASTRATPASRAGVQVLPRERLDAVQRELRAVPGVTVLVYDQTCATEARRRRKRGAAAGADAAHVFINEAVCEGCGDCGVKSNCLSVVPVATEFGTQARDRPVHLQPRPELPRRLLPGARHRRRRRRSGARKGLPLDDGRAPCPSPTLPALDEPYSLLIAGVGGTGVVTLGALLGMAAHLEGKGVTVLDQTGHVAEGRRRC